MTFVMRENGGESSYEALILEKTVSAGGNGKKPLALKMPQRVIPSLRNALSSLMGAMRTQRSPAPEVPCRLQAIRDEMGAIPRADDGTYDLSSSIRDSYPQNVYYLEGNYTLRIEECQWNSERGATGAYDAIVITREVIEEGARNRKRTAAAATAGAQNLITSSGRTTRTAFSFYIPIRLLPALYRAIDLIHRSESGEQRPVTQDAASQTDPPGRGNNEGDDLGARGRPGDDANSNIRRY